jgi:hypothetical protein
MNVRYIPLPPGTRVGGFLEPQELVDARERQKANSWFLVRNNGEAGERWRCGRCNQQHPYFSLMCLPRPWNGIVEALYAFVQTEPENPLTPRIVLPLSNIAQRHPQTTRIMRTDPEAQELFALSIGIVEPIATARAKLFIQAINASGIRPPLKFGPP